MKPSESTHGRTGEMVSFSGDYRALCCGAVKQLSVGQSFPKCPEHGETEWDWIPPFVQAGYVETRCLVIAGRRRRWSISS